MQGRWVAIAWLIGVGALLAQAPEPGLKVVSEVACADLFGPGTYEASGLVLAEGRLHLVFDNLAQVGSLTPDLDPASGALSPGRVGFSDYEAIAYDPELRCFYVAIEAEEVGRKTWRPRILRLDASGAATGSWQVERKLYSDNKGVEGLTFVRRGGKPYLLALLEGNYGESSDRGREVGNGRLLVLGQTADGGWALERELELPKTVAFVDYAGIDVRGDQVAIVSQTSAALWVGTLGDDWSFGEGRLLEFPRQADGSLRYGRVEGVAWLDGTRLALCSDQEAPRDRGKGRVEQAVHVVELLGAVDPPAPAGATRGGLAGRLGGD